MCLVFGLGWFAVVSARLGSGAAKRIGGIGTATKQRQAEPDTFPARPMTCATCEWTGDYKEVAFNMFLDNRELRCPACDGIVLRQESKGFWKE